MKRIEFIFIFLIYKKIYKIGNNDASSLSSLSSFQSSIQSSSNGGITFNNLGNSFTIEPAYDIKCKEENTVDIEVCGKFSIGDENQGKQSRIFVFKKKKLFYFIFLLNLYP